MLRTLGVEGPWLPGGLKGCIFSYRNPRTALETNHEAMRTDVDLPFAEKVKSFPQTKQEDCTITLRSGRVGRYLIDA
jgi:hypothetical protein